MPRRFLLVLLLTIAEVAEAKCVMTQTCVNPGNVPDYDKCIPQAHREPVDPQPMTGEGWPLVIGGGNCTSATDCHNKGQCLDGACVCRHDGMTAGLHCDEYQIQCPAYQASACCSWQQNQALAENFQLVASIFGQNRAGGCDACAANLMTLWCGLVCAPEQAAFLTLAHAWPSTTYRPDPMTGKANVKVLELNVALDKTYTCALFDSCKNTAIASMASGMKSSVGFLTYQMQVGAVGHGEFISMTFNGSKPKSFGDDKVLKCANYSTVNKMRTTLPTQAQLLDSIASTSMRDKHCPCGACRATCDSHTSGNSSVPIFDKNPISMFTGLNTKLVALMYGFVVLFVVVSRSQWMSKKTRFCLN